MLRTNQAGFPILLSIHAPKKKIADIMSKRWSGTLRSPFFEMDLLQFSSGLFRAIFAMKEIENGKEIHRRVPAWCSAHGDDQWPKAASTFIGFRGWAIESEQMGSATSAWRFDVRTAWINWERDHAASQRSQSAAWGEESTKKGRNLLCRPKPVRFSLVDAWKEEWSVEFLCCVMRVTSRGFRSWQVRPMSQRQRDDTVIFAHLRE